MQTKKQSLSERIKRRNRAGFSLVELIVIIAMMAVLIAVLAPSLLGYVERSRAQKDVSAMDEVVNAVFLAMADPYVYDELAQASIKENVSCYIDNKDELERSGSYVQTKEAIGANKAQYMFGDDARQQDEVKFYAAGSMRGTTLTFIPNMSSNESKYLFGEVVVNKFFPDEAESINNLPRLYNAIRSVIGDTVELSSQTYRNSEYTIFVKIGSTGGNQATAQDAMQAYGQFSGTNLSLENREYYIADNRQVYEPEIGTEPEIVANKLATPAIAIDGSVLNITAVNNATEYKIFNGDTLLVSTSATSVDLSGFITENGTYTIKVQAVGGAEYAASDYVTIQYVVSSGAGLPISWNTLDVAGNPSFEYGGLVFAKVSDYLPSVDELERTQLTVSVGGTTMVVPFTESRTAGAAIVVTYVDGSEGCILLVAPAAGEVAELGVTFPEPGLYAMNSASGSAPNEGTMTLDFVQTPIMLAPGLYEPGAIELWQAGKFDEASAMLRTSWDGLVASGAIVLMDGAPAIGSVLPDNITEKNEYGFYYNVEYCIAMEGMTVGLTFNEDGSVIFNTPDGAMEFPTGSATYGDHIIDMTAVGFGEILVINDGASIMLEGIILSAGEPADLSGDLVLSNDGSITNIGMGFMYNCQITGIVIPDSVVIIADYGFDGCENLTHVIMSSNVERLGYATFRNCYSLSSITFAENSKLAILQGEGADGDNDGVFYGCGLSSIELPASLQTIGYGVFESCTNLQNVILHSVPTISSGAFIRCTSLQGNIYDNAKYFRVDDNPYGILIKAVGTDIRDCTIHEDTIAVGASVFSGCESLKTIIYNGTLEQWVNIDFASSVFVNNADFYLGGDLVDNLVIPKNITSINDCAFSGCDSLTSVTIADGVTSIGHYAFAGCDNLTSVTIPDSVTSIGVGVFQSCRGLTNITIPDSVELIDRNAFDSCSSLTNITIGSGVTSVADYAFNGCENLYKIINHSSLNISFGGQDYGQIARYAKIIEDRDGNKTYIDSTWFETEDNLLFSVVDGVYTLRAYVGTDVLVTLPDNVNGNSYKCKSLQGVKNVVLPQGIADIGSQAFYQCRSLTSITIPEGVGSIGSWAFAGCINLTSITIPKSVINIDLRAFDGCDRLMEFIVSDDNAIYTTVDGVLYTKDMSTLVRCPGGKSGEVIIPSGVTSIGKYAFRECIDLTSVDVPNGVTTIDDYAFYGCRRLTSIAIPNSVTSIGQYAFKGCANLTNIVIPNNVTSIGHYAFDQCYGLTSITIPDSITSIGVGVFRACMGLNSIIIPDSITSISNDAFTSCSGLNCITFGGTTSQWQNITKSDSWNRYVPTTVYVQCTDGKVDMNGNIIP